MTTKVRVAPHVEAFVKSRAPGPRKRLTRAVKALARQAGDIRPLEGPLAEYSRLRVGGYRVIFTEKFAAGERRIDCVFAERRSIVYDLFEQLLVNVATGGRARSGSPSPEREPDAPSAGPPVAPG